jgi:hypothetical protein
MSTVQVAQYVACCKGGGMGRIFSGHEDIHPAPFADLPCIPQVHDDDDHRMTQDLSLRRISRTAAKLAPFLPR